MRQAAKTLSRPAMDFGERPMCLGKPPNPCRKPRIGFPETRMEVSEATFSEGGFEAEILDLESSLRRDQRRFEEATKREGLVKRRHARPIQVGSMPF